MGTKLMIEIFGSILVVTVAPIIWAFCYWWWCDISDYRRAVREAKEYYLATEDDVIHALSNSEYGATLDTKMAMNELIHAEGIIDEEKTNEHYHLLIPLQMNLLETLIA